MVDTRTAAYRAAGRGPLAIFDWLDACRDPAAAERYLAARSPTELAAAGRLLGWQPHPDPNATRRDILRLTVKARVARAFQLGAHTPGPGHLADTIRDRIAKRKATAAAYDGDAAPAAAAGGPAGDVPLSALLRAVEELRDSLDPADVAEQGQFVRGQRERVELPDEAATAAIISAMETLEATLAAVEEATAAAYEAAGLLVDAVADAVLSIGTAAQAAAATGDAADFTR